MPDNCTAMSAKQVQQAFLKAQPLIAAQIRDLTVQIPNFIRDMYNVSPFPLGNGTSMEELVYRGAMPAIERGFDKWRTLGGANGCNDCDGPDCSYNWTDLGGGGIERKVMQIMDRDFRSEAFCVKEIQTTAHFRQVMGKIIENLYRQVDFFKEHNIGFNALTSLAKKYVIDSTGPRPNPENPYVYRNILGARLSMLNMDVFTHWYNWMRMLPDVIPMAYSNGQPQFGALLSPEMLSRLYRDDPGLRQDVRATRDGTNNELLHRYNFVTTIRDMFIPIPYMYPRRFNISESGEPLEVFPYVNNVPLETGFYTSINPLYLAATHEEILLFGMHPFEIYAMPTVETLGDNSSFGPEVTMFDEFQWVNPQTDQDPGRRQGYFWTSATIGISQQYSQGIFGILVERPQANMIATFFPNPEGPPDPSEVDNEVPTVACPCPQIVDAFANPLNAAQYYIILGAPIETEGVDDVLLGITTGGYVTASLEGSSDDNKRLLVEIEETLQTCDFTSIYCADTLECRATVTDWSVNCDDAGNLDLVLDAPIKAVDAADVVVLTLGNGTVIDDAVVVSVDMANLTWVVDSGDATFCNNNGGVAEICVPPDTDDSCPACSTGPSFDQCEDT